ncbi:ubiquitin-protein ligase E3B-like [Ptychodera flava]|uniref:ubiquitin-protein ligase E3B-like n=1 Tax=Ptychodera flava TaxID=63121 RepID=UPI003969F2A1
MGITSRRKSVCNHLKGPVVSSQNAKWRLEVQNYTEYCGILWVSNFSTPANYISCVTCRPYKLQVIMFSKVDATKRNEFLDKQKEARNERANLKHRDDASIKIQAAARGFLARKRVRHLLTNQLDAIIEPGIINKDASGGVKPKFSPAFDLYIAVKRFLFVFNEKKDKERFEKLCRYIVACMDAQGEPKVWYVSLALSKDYVLQWIQQLKFILWQCCRYMKTLKPESPNDGKVLTLYLHMLFTFTDTATWKILKVKGGENLASGMSQLCANVMGHLNSKGIYLVLKTLLLQGLARSKPAFKHATLAAIINIALRPLVAGRFTDNLLTVFLVHILSVPAIVLHLFTLAPECLTVLKTHEIFKRSLHMLSSEQNTKIVFNSLEGNYALCLLANLVQLGNIDSEALTTNVAAFTRVVGLLLSKCQSYVALKKSNNTHWHPVLGWFSQLTDHGLHEAMPFVVRQLQLLWNPCTVKLLFNGILSRPLQTPDGSPEKMVSPPPPSATSPKNVILRKLQRSGSKSGGSNSKGRSITSPEVKTICSVCELYQTALVTLTQLRMDILTGLSYQDVLLSNLWRFIGELGPHGPLKLYTENLQTMADQPIFSALTLFCDCAGHLITVLDDLELYEQQKPFRVADLVAMSKILNTFVFRMIWDHGIFDSKSKYSNLFNSCHNLLMLLYDRDCRRSFTPENHWLMKDLKASVFVSELEKAKRRAQIVLQKIPHVIPHRDRVILFRKYVSNEKAALSITESVSASPASTLITVHRPRLIEDGYRQLAALPAQSLKGVIRVRFVNEQGLDEAGIDQDGVFKEFLEETIKTVFDPSLNLFKMTSGEQRLYPSPTSYIQENHLQLFEFVGRMLGKAVYEGIVVEVPFASFFLSQVLGHQHSSLYSPIDELPSLDPGLYKSLTFIKHYDNDIADLDLTFSYDEDVMGKVITHELMPGGRAIPVTNENKISYIHLMAHFKMNVQIREQTQAFIYGFKSIVNLEWLSWFSTPELQRLISGDTADIDLQDLRKHTQYYGGFHNQHRVVTWLWDILQNDFTKDEKALFLKFVTSCSKPPLLGFANLEPPFSIRCVEVSEDQDTGDTLGSVLRGFFTIRKKDPVGRLPTSSTCFNLLKLPNYQKKSTLREKLRYSITSNTGFELS